jgi:hypothetical protein
MSEDELMGHVLAVLPTGLPGKRYMAIARSIQNRIPPGNPVPTYRDLRTVLGLLQRLGLVHSQEHPDPEEGGVKVYWREPAYTPPLDVGVSS